MKENKFQKGITLISLVITIIILIILAGVTLSMVAGNGGILGQTETAVIETNIEEAKEQAQLLLSDVFVDYYNSTERAGPFIQNRIGETGKLTPSGKYFVTVGAKDANEKYPVTVYEGNNKNGIKVITGKLNISGRIEWDPVPSGGSGTGNS